MIELRWSGPVIVCGSGPSLTPEIAEQCRALPCIAINDAHRLIPWAEVLYASDLKWWEHHNPSFAGLKVIPNSGRVKAQPKLAKSLGLTVIEGRSADRFSLDRDHIAYGVLGTGAFGGFQAINLALLMGGNPILLVGFDMRAVDNRAHFFGQHPRPLMQYQNFRGWIRNLTKAAERLPDRYRIINATPGSALECFPIMPLAEAIREATNGPETHHATVELSGYA